MHGEAGLGNAIAYNVTASRWTSEDPSTPSSLSATGTTSSTDFYEVVDTAIIIAKGKRSSTLQTYHHAGAMMCMWSGIRYMSPPIWAWVAYNSGIHTMMYTYYTLTALSVPIPQTLKKSLTTMQIIQFLVGASYAAIHSFIAYIIPIQVPSPKGSPAALKHHTAYQTVSCINTSGETFAIWFNVLYLTPLTMLFVRFFVKSYFRSPKDGKRSSSKKVE
ncbi:uncharacterized protein LY89DRAFT_741678 [Mollisia scopiformis]|uniref:Elongation of fatty acids protein n=1 Tax=Mollisia scopiformis TaxID=149040 RepID=A0A132B8V7_MOLSC|nr:uncharacterized protein LY89DRAFT_741678 [Mollisia scopiformis]KUJ08842.1 hypothetical protein LY89DRAFT_741678 [Mollisia scopiformis]